ncbi:TetR/AcrR family transcriptional regulator [Ectothiorhodospiraceae bacterium WFHF3C12]|nr:TetR/AcrR family transcriptional regulator [Ectothiorhodospiraceae bacterium WFHF3C12]
MAPPSKRAEQGRATRDALIVAARKEFARQGYANASVDDIVRLADVTKGAFYHHFSGKEDLFLRVFENVKKELSRGAFITHAEHQPFAQDENHVLHLKRFTEQTNEEIWAELRSRCRRYIELHSDASIRQIVLVDARWVLSWETWQRVEREYGVTLLRADLRRAMQRGIIRRLPLTTLAAIIVGALNEACLLVANAADSDEALDEAMSVIEPMLNGLIVDA